MKTLAFALLLLPTAALADFDCHRPLWRRGLRPLGGPWSSARSANLARDRWPIHHHDGGRLPQQGMSGLVSIYPTGEVSFTAHAYSGQAIAITGSGNCAGVGG